MSLASDTSVSTIGAPNSSPCCNAVTNIATCSESLRRRSSAKAWRRLMPRSICRGDAEFVGPGALVLGGDPVQGLPEAEARADHDGEDVEEVGEGPLDHVPADA